MRDSDSKNHLYRILSRFVEIKQGEELISIFLFSYFFLITAPYYIVKSLKVANYLDKQGANKLPLAYLMTAILTGFVVAFHSKLQVKIPRRILVISCLIFFNLTCLFFWLFFHYNWSWLALTYWVWSDIFIIVLVTQFWIFVNEILNPREAKRLIGFFGSGGILGGIVGGEVIGLFAKSEVSYDFLLVTSGMLVVCTFVVNYIFRWEKSRQSDSHKFEEKNNKEKQQLSPAGFKDCFDAVKGNIFLKLIGASVTIAVIVSTLIDWQFNSVVENTLFIRNNLTAFFGHFNAGLLIFSFFLQLLMTSRIIKHLGIRFALLLFPMTLFFLSLGFAAFPIIYIAILIKGSDKSLHYSLDQSVHKILYIPVSPEIKHKAEMFIDMFLYRFARSFGAVILMIVFYFHLGIQYVILISTVLILTWIVLNLKVYMEYVSSVKQKIKVKWGRADKIVAEKLDVDYTKLVFDTLESKNRSSVLYAMHVFDLIKQDKLTPEVKNLISNQADEMRISSLGTLFETEETKIVPEIDDYIDEEILKNEINEIMSLDVYQEVMKNHVEAVLSSKSKEAETARMEVAKAIGLMESNSPIVQKLEELLHDESPDVRRYAMESAVKLKKKKHISALIQNLRNPLTREDACNALEKQGPEVVPTLGDYLTDFGEEIELRKTLASVLARIGSQEAVNILLMELAEDKGDINNELIDALDRIRSEKPDCLFLEKTVKVKIIIEIKKYYRILIEHHDLKSKGKEKKMGKSLEKNLADSLMNIFILLGLIYTHEDMVKAYQNIKTGTKDSVAYAIELLDNSLKKDMKDIILAIIEDLSLEDRVKRFQNLLKTLPDYDSRFYNSF